MISFKNKHNRRFGSASNESAGSRPFGSVCCDVIAVMLGLTALTACTDWNDHYDADTAITESQQATLWQNIEKTQQISQFASLLKKTGYDERLDASQTYTVWAPIDGSFDYDQLSAQGNERLLKQFVQNHIARYNYPATGSFNQKVYMLNEKLMLFKGAGTFTIQDVELSQSNIGSSNGTIHLIKSKIPFLPNIYESLNNEDYALDSVSKYFHNYDIHELDETKSVPGPIVNGEQTYLDSVFYEDNMLTRTFRSYINREDSNYTMVLPTNDAWQAMKSQIQSCYNYVPSFRFMRATAAGSDTTLTVTLKDAVQFKDSISNYMLMKNLMFNNNIYDNTKLKTLTEASALTADSLVSTTGSVIYGDDTKTFFDGATRVNKSNGAIWVSNKLDVLPWNAWNPEITAEAEQYVYKTEHVGESKSVRVNSSNQNPEVTGYISNNYYLEAHPSTPNDHPDVFIHLPKVRSTEYNVYLVMAPGNIVSKQAEHKPNSISVYIRTTNDEGVLRGEEQLKNPVDGSNMFVTDSVARIDTLFLGSYTFPIAYYGTGENYPYMRVRSRFSSSKSSLYDRTLRIDCIILRPKALDEYLKDHPGYKYDKHNY